MMRNNVISPLAPWAIATQDPEYLPHKEVHTVRPEHAITSRYSVANELRSIMAKRCLGFGPSMIWLATREAYCSQGSLTLTSRRETLTSVASLHLPTTLRPGVRLQNGSADSDHRLTMSAWITALIEDARTTI
ncbi:hypothetical protein FN846DRAFT_887651 [Sphaerosporella brunnea]|uniref:Uncharacterized protein n=1 Tax=Sphaerosporella brunnea TaxID=1250544 RepID=A0A5J5F5L0_9PEZI|nr:hypothetical protein FN846DRAFT_887651 [Sphaerosporella brunnea]